MAKSQENGITILLGLKGYRIGKVTEYDKGIVVQVRVRKEMSYSHCNSPNVHGHGACKPRKVLHGRRNGEKVYLELYRRRWKCQGYHRTFSDVADLLRAYSRIIRPAEREVLWQLKDRGFSKVTRELG